MLDRGLSEDGAAIALGWPKARITARVKLLELPELAQQMVGDGRLALAAVEPLRAISAVSREVLDCVVNHIAGDGYGADRFAREPGWVTAQAIQSHGGVFGALLTDLHPDEIEGLKLGKRATEQCAQLCELAKQLDRYAYGTPRVPFTEDDVDQARAAGVLIEFEGARPIIIERSVYRELAKQAIKRHVQTLTDRIRQAQERKATTPAERAKPSDPLAGAKREHGRAMRALAEQAHTVNTDLGWSLRNGLASVEIDMNVARLFVFSLLGGDYDGSPYTQSGSRVAELAMRGIRLVIEDFRTDVTKTKKDGTRGALRISYGDPRKPQDAIAWLWRYLDSATNPQELFGRAIIVMAAEKYALRMVVPTSQQHPPIRWSSHKDLAEKALAKLVSPHLPASLKQLEKAIAKANAAYETEQEQIREAARKRAIAERRAAAAAGELDDDAQPTGADDNRHDDDNLDGDEEDLEGYDDDEQHAAAYE